MTNVLQEAEEMIFGERQAQYGDPSVSFTRIAEFWSSYTGVELDALDVANMMVLLKVSRTKGQFHRDSYVDIGGYAGLAERIHYAHVEDEEPEVVDDEVVPRVWASIFDVPEGVRVEDCKGDPFWWARGQLTWAPGLIWGEIGPNFNEDLQPFTEVLSG